MAFSAGFYVSRQISEREGEKRVASAIHGLYRSQASQTTQVLQHLADGRQSEVRKLLERQLDAAVINTVLYWENYTDRVRPLLDASVVRAAREYRSRHPWSEQGQDIEGLEHAFKWVD